VCEGYGLIKNVEPAGLAALRKLQTRCLRDDFGKVHMRVPPEIAHWILNHKRDDLSGLERRHSIRVLVEPKGSLLRHESEFEFFPREKVEVPPALVAGDRPAPPTPPDLIDMEGPSPAPPLAAAVVVAPVAAADRDEGEAGVERLARRRRRGRRGGRGRGGDAAVDPARTAVPADVASGAAPAPEGPGDESESNPPEDRLAEPEEAAAGSVAATPGANGEGGQPRRRRRRGRRGRGRGSAVAGAAQGGDDSVPPAPMATFAAIEDEAVVPRGVVAHELMPAATGGRPRRRGHRGGRARRPGLGGEPVDPQLISPSNPVPKPGFDED